MIEEKKNKQIIEVRKKLEKIAQSAIDNNLIQSWYYNGISFVVKFKEIK